MKNLWRKECFYRPVGSRLKVEPKDSHHIYAPLPPSSSITCASLTNGQCHGNISMATWQWCQSGSMQLSRENLGNVCLVAKDDNSVNHWKKLNKRRLNSLHHFILWQWDEALALFGSIVCLPEDSRLSFIVFFLCLWPCNGERMLPVNTALRG